MLGKSTIIDIMLMAKGMLFNNYWTYIASGNGSQAEQTFITLERIANDNIDTMVGSTGYIFKQEVEIKNTGAGDGFSHNPSGFTYSLYNGSMTRTLNSSIDSNRGFRGNVVFDETGFLSAEMLATYAAFAIVNKSFKSGKDRDGNVIDMNRLRAIPEEIPNQVFYISSASSTDTEFYNLYRDFSKQMLLGNPNYFVAHIDCEVAFKPTIHGEVVSPLLSRTTVESAMRANPEKARREYYCQFTTDAGVNAIIRRGSITRNEEIRKPVLCNETGENKYFITYDPARIRDNSVVLIGEKYEEGREIKCRIVNRINLIDIEKRNKTPMTIPNQVKELRKIILDYNIGGDEFYSNILGVYIDAGAGGQASAICDLLMQDWIDEEGILHRGIIDKEYSSDYVKRFPNAIDKVKMMVPGAYKSEMYEALIQMIDENHLKFTATYDGRGTLTTFTVDKDKENELRKILSDKYSKKDLSDYEVQKIINKEISESLSSDPVTIKLDMQEEIALAGIDAMKEELVNMVRIKRDSGKDSFELCPEKRNKMHDDAAYTCAMLGYALKSERRKKLYSKPKKNNLDIAMKLASQYQKATRTIR